MSAIRGLVSSCWLVSRILILFGVLSSDQHDETEHSCRWHWVRVNHWSIECSRSNPDTSEAKDYPYSYIFKSVWTQTYNKMLAFQLILSAVGFLTFLIMPFNGRLKHMLGAQAAWYNGLKQHAQEKYGENKFKLGGICYYESGNSGERCWKKRNNTGVKRLRKFRGSGYQKEEWSEKSRLKTLLRSWADNLPVFTLPQERRVIFPTSLVTFFFLSPSRKCSEFCLFKQVTKTEHIKYSISGKE